MSKESIALKEKAVAEIQEKIQKAKSVVLIDYRGLTVSEDTAMRNELRAASALHRYFVIIGMYILFHGYYTSLLLA